MQKYDAIEKGIANNDVKALREAVGSICYTCRDFSDGEFDNVIKYIESKGIKIKDDNLVGNPTISSQKDSFTDEDFAKAVFELKKNFCDERIDDVKKIGRKLYGVLQKNKNSQSKNNMKPSNNAGESKYPKVESHQQKSIIIPVAIGMVAVIVIIIIIVILIRK